MKPIVINCDTKEESKLLQLALFGLSFSWSGAYKAVLSYTRIQIYSNNHPGKFIYPYTGRTNRLEYNFSDIIQGKFRRVGASKLGDTVDIPEEFI
jgi:hypothetical protein